MLYGYYHFIEPGYYEDGSFGIRIESLLVTVKASTEVKYSNRFLTRFDYKYSSFRIVTKTFNISHLNQLHWYGKSATVSIEFLHTLIASRFL